MTLYLLALISTAISTISWLVLYIKTKQKFDLVSFIGMAIATILVYLGGYK